MQTSASELVAQIRVTRAFVDADFEEITLIPRVLDKTTTGGTKFVEQTARDPQRFHVVDRNSNAATRTRVPGGEQHEVEFTLVGYPEALIGEHDIFTLRGAQWEVLTVDWFNGYEQRAQVIRYGR